MQRGRSQTSIFIGVSIVALVLLVASAQSAPPKVVSASPDNGQQNVDPKTAELRIVFDQPMRPDSYSLTGGGSSFPKLIGQRIRHFRH